MRHIAIIMLSFACLLTGCRHDGAMSSSNVKKSDSASIYQDMAYQAMFADSLVQAETCAYRSLMLSTDSTLECGALSLLCYIYYREGKHEKLQMMMQMLSPEAYVNVMNVQMLIEQQKSDRQRHYYALAVILLLLLSGGVALWYLYRIRSLRTLYQQRIALAKHLLEGHEHYGLSDAVPQTALNDGNNQQMTSQEIVEVKLGFDVLYAIIDDQNISQMGKHEKQALLKALPMVDANLCSVFALAKSPLTPKETFFCLMEYYGKNDHQKAVSFCCSDQAIRSIKSRLSKKLDIGQLR